MILSLIMITMTMMMMMIIVWARRVPIVGVPMGTGWLSSSQKGAAAHTRDTPRTVERGKGKGREGKSQNSHILLFASPRG